MAILLFFFVGGIISVLGGFFGVGGGFILTPILLLTGFSPLVAITTSLFFTIGTSISGIFAHYRLKNIMWKEGMILGLSGVAATQLAHPVVLFFENRGWDDVIIPAFYALLLGYFAISMMRRGKKASIQAKKTYSKPSIVKLLFIGFFGGFVSTLLGVGGGFIMVPLSISFLGLEPRKAVGTSLFAVLSIVSVGFISYALTVSFDYRVGLLLIAGGLVGSQFGAKLTVYFQNYEISQMLSVLYVATFLSVILKLLNLSEIGLGLISLFVAIFFIFAFMKIHHKRKEGSMAN
ncbi:sulfite exporter TauE/SafE family protein [Bacillus massilinigeriensis]|uniref:sulfite exporter TauE/SafE family protein n=1 Tax=Bacillus massilionigeriensis TaxID=1805475 RepID=UPI00096B38F3|nr:sulfite exporter TauE/SafE family protein [Bacillus massilionigeriensis]